MDCIEFDERFRHADPVADMAFLVMDFARHGRRDLGRAFAEAYSRAAGDAEGRTLLPFYAAYRAAVRGKVEGLKHAEGEIPAADRAAALDKALACWLLALGELEVPGRRPCLVLVGGLPGTGKSSLGRAMAEQAGLTVIRSDLVRKELAGLAGGVPAPAEYGKGIYSREWDERTYAECSRRAESLLFEGRRVLVDASFGREADRRHFLELAARRGVPEVFFSAGPSRPSSGRGSSAAGTTPPMPTGPSLWKPPHTGRSRVPSRCVRRGRSTPEGTKSKRRPGPSAYSETWDSWTEG